MPNALKAISACVSTLSVLRLLYAAPALAADVPLSSMFTGQVSPVPHGASSVALAARLASVYLRAETIGSDFEQSFTTLEVQAGTEPQVVQTLVETVTLAPPMQTVTVTKLPTTVFITVTSAPAGASSSAVRVPSNFKQWAAPVKMTNLTAFNVTAFPGGQHNLKLVTSIPASASAVLRTSHNVASETTWDNSSTLMQLRYPAGSIDPARKPQGGAEFYASPIPLEHAINVTLQYSVFFPENFDWVLGGKLPGLYGGHSGCSGGNAALDCFSTRLMWRSGGLGELYLYAPKAKQTKALCSDPHSACNVAYGFSVGRGLFKWSAGNWTTVQQTVWLNTPGEQNGGFVLDVNGRRVISRSDVFYRSALLPSSKPIPTSSVGKTTSTASPVPSSTNVLGGILGPILGSLLHPSLKKRERLDDVINVQAVFSSQTGFTEPTSTTKAVATPIFPAATSSMADIPLPNANAIINAETKLPMVMQTIKGDREIGFVGIFFSTFFGGHDDKYATPRDQFVWFKDFAVTNNS